MFSCLRRSDRHVRERVGHVGTDLTVTMLLVALHTCFVLSCLKIK